MAATEIQQAIVRAIQDHRLLDHPFYVRWENGELGADELTTYAEQYRAIEAVLPATLEAIAAKLPEGAARDLVAANLADERSNPAPHVELFEQFATAVGAKTDVETLPGATGVVERYRSASATDPIVGLATLAAYELQGADIAASKADGLRRHYGIDASGTAFWDVHSDLEAAHASWSIDALASHGADADAVFDAAHASAVAWWSFLDEREAAACAS